MDCDQQPMMFNAISQQHNVVELYNKLNEQTVAKAYYESKQQQKKARWESKWMKQRKAAIAPVT